MSRKIFIIACEASGDVHGSYLVQELLKQNSGFQFRGIGGDKMRQAGVPLLEDMTKISALGLGDVLRLYFRYRKIFYNAIRDIREWQPDLVLVIDSPAFNLRLAKKISKEFRVMYYIAPQIWAWGARRIHTIKKHISELLVILPFEAPLYEKAKVPCKFVGHPLLDELNLSESKDSLREKHRIPTGQCAVGLLPGSRESEVRRIFPVMLEAARRLHKRLPETSFFLRMSPNVSESVYEELQGNNTDLPLQRFEKTQHDLIRALDFAFVTSGTATLETALFGTPFFLLYKTSWSTYFLGKHLIRVPFLGLVNLLAGKSVVPEFIQGEACPKTIAHEAEVLLNNRELYDGMKKEFEEIRTKLGTKGASQKAATEVIRFLGETP